MIYNCPKCGLSKSDGAMSSTLPQCKCDWNSALKREWVGLTAEELEEIAEFHFHGGLSGREFYDDIEAKLKEKNSGR